MKAGKSHFVLPILLLISLAACGDSVQPTQDVNTILTRGVGTMVASFFGTQTAIITPASPTATVTQTPFPSPTLFFSSTAPPTQTVPYVVYSSPVVISTATQTPSGSQSITTATIDPLLLGAGCNNLAFIRDVTIPPGTVLKPGQDFIKIWKVQNTGTCPWMYQYYLVSISGGDLVGAGVVKLQKKVEVNSWTELSVDVTAPKKEGTYSSYWRLADANGVMFGATLVLSFEVVE